MNPRFHAMREDLRARGLLDAGFGLTEAGHAYAEQLIAELRSTEARYDRNGPRVFWRIDLRSNAGRASSAARRAA